MSQFRQMRKEAVGEESPELESIFKALADSTRRQILWLLHRRSYAVGEIVDHFHLTQPSISRHLGILRSVGLVGHRRRGQQVIYDLGDPRLLEAASAFLGSVSVEPVRSDLQQDARRAS